MQPDESTIEPAPGYEGRIFRAPDGTIYLDPTPPGAFPVESVRCFVREDGTIMGPDGSTIGRVKLIPEWGGDTPSREPASASDATQSLPPGPGYWVRRLDDVLQSLTDYVRFMGKLAPHSAAPKALLACLRPGYNAILEWEGREAPPDYSDIKTVTDAVLDRLATLGRDHEAFRAPLPRVPALPAVPAQPELVFTSLLAVSGDAGGPLFDPQFDPQKIKALLDAVAAFLKELKEKLGEIESDALRILLKEIDDLILDVFTERDFASLKALFTGLASLLQLLIRLGYHGIYEWAAASVKVLIEKFMALMVDEAGGATAGFAIEFAIVLIWAWLVVKFGNWFWNRPALDGQSYVDWWGDRFYGFYKLLAGRDCDELLDEWMQADRDLRGSEAGGGNLGEICSAAIHAGVLANHLLRECPKLGVGPTLRRRIAHDTAQIAAFEKMIEAR